MPRNVVAFSNMAASGCVFRRTFGRSRPGSVQASSPAVCRETLYVLELQRYSRDQCSAIYFPQTVFCNDYLYDITLSDGDCRLRVTLDPSINQLVEQNVIHAGSALKRTSFCPAITAPVPACPGASADRYRLVSVEVRSQVIHEDEGLVNVEWHNLPWYGSSEEAGPLTPLRAKRNLFLPMWNNVDYYGDSWLDSPLAEGDSDEDEVEEQLPAVTVTQLRERFFSRGRGLSNGRTLIVRITNKSHLLYYGRTEQNCECPYKAILDVCDPTGSVSVVMWNSLCVRWYRCLRPGDVISLKNYKVKKSFEADGDDIEISLNSRNPTAHIRILPDSLVSPEFLPPLPTYNFSNSQQILNRPAGTICDVIGLLMFSGRPERMRNSDGRRTELLEYRWLQLEDGSSDKPIMVKLFSTSQPDIHCKLFPLSVIVCTRVKVIKPPAFGSGCCYLTNTTYTQVYCTGQGHHSKMSYRTLQPVKQFIHWLNTLDEVQVKSRALFGGYFIYPPPSTSLDAFVKATQGNLDFLQGAELHREMGRLHYRERRRFCFQAVVVMVAYCNRGQEHHSLFWMDRSFQLSPAATQLSSLFSPHSSRPPPSSPSSSSVALSSVVGQVTPRLQRQLARKRRLSLQTPTPSKRCPQVALQPEPHNKTDLLFGASIEFLDNIQSDEEANDVDEAPSSMNTLQTPPSFSHVAIETLTMRFDHELREEQMHSIAMGGRPRDGWVFDSEDYYALRLRALSDGALIDAIFRPSSETPTIHQAHSNTWVSILSHGAFSSHTPPPSPSDLIGMAGQLTNQRLVCVLEVCHLGGTSTEAILSRAFQLTD
ncbi:RPA-related protein RADX [Synchiropus splendidus]|uniref:RPA-related protein RADX n=1 Tax=Synchiropus splendidus TaxID=270530 RepID=UPI00237E4A70|nr:RPA-related protein RADX [Synchiropus splendidus]